MRLLTKDLLLLCLARNGLSKRARMPDFLSTKIPTQVTHLLSDKFLWNRSWNHFWNHFWNPLRPNYPTTRAHCFTVFPNKMSAPLTCLVAVATIFFLPVLAQAVAFTNGYYTGITAGTSFVLNWSGDNTVCPFLPCLTALADGKLSIKSF